MENYRSRSLVASSIKQDAGLSAPADADSPHIVIRGESPSFTPSICNQLLSDKISFIDYLSFTYRSDSLEFDLFPLQNVLTDVFNIPFQDWSVAKSGWNGYKYRANLGSYGLIAWGGESQKNTFHVQLTGNGCFQVLDWIKVASWGIKNKVKITRTDIAHDDILGRTINIMNALKWVDEGSFNQNGRPPNIRYIDDYNSGKGKTLYVGERKNGKLIRIYEKGKEQGDPHSPWCRAEVEFRSKDRKIDWNLLINPDQYISGSCKAFTYLSQEQSRLETISKSKNITLDRAIKYCRIGYGQLINLVYVENGNDPDAVVRILARDGIPNKLKTYYQAKQRRTYDNKDIMPKRSH